MSSITVAALYRFMDLPNYKDFQPVFASLCKEHGIKGTLLLALEGINGTVAGSREAIDALKTFLEDNGFFDGMEYKESFADSMPFYRMKVRLKKEIVTLGVDDVNPSKDVGAYLNPKEWNELLKDPEVILIDTRNTYETEIGTFKGAVDPRIETFRELPKFIEKNYDPEKHKKIAMFCTGGIRCEKSTSYMKMKNFENVYHLKGGILKYLEEISESESLWEGECFVFDHRVGVTHGLGLGETELCHGCRQPITQSDKESPYYERGVSCHHCYDATSQEHKISARNRQYQIDLAKERGKSHLGSPQI